MSVMFHKESHFQVNKELESSTFLNSDSENVSMRTFYGKNSQRSNCVQKILKYGKQNFRKNQKVIVSTDSEKPDANAALMA